jgi:hypothetical protein
MAVGRNSEFLVVVESGYYLMRAYNAINMGEQSV